MKADDFIKTAEIMKALAHPTRLFIIELLKEGELCVCEITEKVGADISTVSKHLKILRKCGILADRREKNKIFMRLAIPCVVDTVECCNRFMSISSN